MAPYKQRRRYDKAFKLEVLRMIQQSDRTIQSIAQELGIHPGVISRWRRQFREQENDAFPGKGHQTPEDEEIRRLKKQLADVKEERDILKKAVAFFAKHPE
jgi:transposase